jgi:hypothetical protein
MTIIELKQKDNMRLLLGCKTIGEQLLKHGIFKMQSQKQTLMLLRIHYICR